jgi:hypothetical protein
MRAPAPFTIDPAAVYDEAAVILSFDLSSDMLARARRRGDLRSSRRGRRTYYLGQWLLDWLLRQGGNDVE